LWLTLSLLPVLLFVSATVAWFSVKLPVQHALATHMPSALADAVRFSVEQEPILHLVSRQIEADLSALQVEGWLPIFHDCHVSLLTLDHTLIPTPNARGSNPLQRMPLTWSRGGREVEAAFALHCQWNGSTLLGLNLGLTLMTLAIILLLPAASGARELAIRARLIAAGFDAVTASHCAREVSGHPDPHLSKWLDRTCALATTQQYDIDWLKQVVLAENTICFDHSNQRVAIHGLSVTLPRTPYFYYAWYALRRCHSDNEGWVLNPAPERPEASRANQLIALMQAHGGHRKAINELLTHGIRGKLLDQNRNKIKEELTAVLGEELAADYLFESERDLRSGRYRYRLRLSPEAIRIAPGPDADDAGTQTH